MTTELIPGKTYYSLMYYDKECRFPSINAYIYTGINLRITDVKADTWYFQDPVTHMLYGPLVEYPKELHSGVKAVDKQFLSTVYDLTGLIEQLSTIRDREPQEKEFLPGKLVYFIEYCDLDLMIPIFNAYIYVGETIEHDSEGLDKVMYLFQEPSTYVAWSQSEAPDIEDADISADAESLHRFLDLRALIDLLLILKEKLGA